MMNLITLILAVIGWITISALSTLFFSFVIINFKPVYRQKFYNDIEKKDWLNYIVLGLHLPITLLLLLVDWFINDYSEWKKQQKKILEESLSFLKNR